MSTETRSRFNPLVALMQVFNSGADIENSYVVKLDEEQKKSQSRADEMMEKSSKPINVNGGKTEKKGGFGKKINPDTEKAMRAMHEKTVKQNTVEDKERE